jgi:co-chaperonin GroES (HSP10)
VKKLMPNLDHVLVEVHPPEERTKSGLYLPQDAAANAKTYNTGTVIGVGPGVWDSLGTKRTPPDYQEGDFVLFGKFAGMRINLDGKDLCLLGNHELFGKLAEVPDFPKD